MLAEREMANKANVREERIIVIVFDKPESVTRSPQGKSLALRKVFDPALS